MKFSRKIYSLVLCICLVFACSKPNTTLPIGEEKLKDILIDVHMAEAAFQPIVGKKKDSLKELYFLQIFEIHEVHPVDFEATMEILQKEPKRMKKIYKDLTEEVQKKKMEFRKKQGLDNKIPKSNSRQRPDTLSPK